MILLILRFAQLQAPALTLHHVKLLIACRNNIINNFKRGQVVLRNLFPVVLTIIIQHLNLSIFITGGISYLFQEVGYLVIIPFKFDMK